MKLHEVNYFEKHNEFDILSALIFDQNKAELKQTHLRSQFYLF